jgi:hypothetical protein
MVIAIVRRSVAIPIAVVAPFAIQNAQRGLTARFRDAILEVVMVPPTGVP